MLNAQTLDDLRALGEDDPSFFKTLLQAFVESLDLRLPSIDNAIQENSADNLALSAHALKSSCYNLGAQLLGDLCQELEKLGKSGSLVGSTALWKNLSAEAILVRAEINALPEMKNI
jgi:HPt (histidine-containing phosphotransfer) domain-containing protein